MTDADGKRETRRRREASVDWLLRNQDAARGQAAEEDFRCWLSRDPRNPAAYREAQRLMGDARTAILTDPALASYQPRPAQPGLRNAIVGACVVAMALGGGYLLDLPMRLRADAFASSGEMPIVTLPDGSRMQLNASSAAEFDFTSTQRVVHLLRGEAFFEVAADPARPFVVTAANGRTTALGTAFNVRLSDAETGVTVGEHAVEVATDGAGDDVRVEHGHEVAYLADGTIGAVGAVDLDLALAWRRGLLVVDNATLQSVVAEIARHYPGRIVIAGDALARRRVSGTFSISDPDAAFDTLERTLGIEVDRLGSLLVVLRS